jgi:hypothetical protein
VEQIKLFLVLLLLLRGRIGYLELVGELLVLTTQAFDLSWVGLEYLLAHVVVLPKEIFLRQLLSVPNILLRYFFHLGIDV